jgi:hypothetical protein
MIELSEGARQPVREAWSLERLTHQRSIALGLSIDPSSHNTYTSALNSYITFCRIHNFPIEPTPDTFSFFVVYMSHHIRPESVDSYLSGICNQLESHFPNVRAVRKSVLVTKTLKGCKRLRGKAVNRKLPLSRPQLQSAITALSNSMDHDDKLFLAMLLTGFYGLLRLAELSMPDTKKLRDYRKFTKRTTVVFLDESQYSFWLPTHKADTTFEGNLIIIPTKSVANPVPVFRCYLDSRDSAFPLHPLLWVRSNGTSPTRSWFIRKLRLLFPDSRIAGQSMRAGGATALAEDGVTPHLIQSSGRWSSETFHIYIRKNPVLLQALLFPVSQSTAT